MSADKSRLFLFLFKALLFCAVCTEISSVTEGPLGFSEECKAVTRLIIAMV